MKIDYISYWSAKPYVGDLDLKEQLPVSVQKDLLQDEKFKYGIYVDASYTNLIKEIDQFFKIGKNKNVVKYRFLEIDASEIPSYTHFRINPKLLEHGRQLLFDLRRPQCKSEICPWGSEISSPVVIKSKTVRRLGIAQIGWRWGSEIELILSSELKALFDREGVSGLCYEPCICDTDTDEERRQSPKAYLARVTPRTYQCADDIILKVYCRKHKIILSFRVFNERTPRSSILDYDFQVIKELRVGRKIYSYYRGCWIISQKALQLLLRHKVPGLQPYGRILGEKFLPFLIEED